MLPRLTTLFAVAAGVSGIGLQMLQAQKTIALTFPRGSSLTLVQRLNREGVLAVEKGDYKKAADVFYKAYLYDPADPFTLNNLGYVSELQGHSERADRFYALAEQQGSSADIDLSNVRSLVGQSMQAALTNRRTVALQINHINVDAMRLLSQNRGAEAALQLEQALALDSHSPFTLNNLGVAYETIGDYDAAMRNYLAAAKSPSSERVAITQDASWQGRPLSEIAAANAIRLGKRMGGSNTTKMQAAVLSLKGVVAENQNDWVSARREFLQAYALDPGDPFSLNNRGYVAELDGDLETAQFFYEKAWKAAGHNLRVGLATQQSAEGMPLARVATESNRTVDRALNDYSQGRRGQGAPVELTPRDNNTALPPSTVPK